MIIMIPFALLSLSPVAKKRLVRRLSIFRFKVVLDPPLPRGMRIRKVYLENDPIRSPF